MSEASAKAAKTVTAAVLIIGNEILSGRIKDANLNYLALELNKLGIRLREARVVADAEGEIVAAVNELRRSHDYLFTTGGIGPTHDDITAASVAKAFGVALRRHPGAVEALARRLRDPADLNEARLRMANVPEGGVLIDNPLSGAPGFEIGNVFVMAGVPAVMQAMFEALRSRLRGGEPLRARTLVTDLREGDIAERLGELQAHHPEVQIGSYPFYRERRFGVSLVLRATDEAALERTAAELREMLLALGGEAREETPG